MCLGVIDRVIDTYWQGLHVLDAGLDSDSYCHPKTGLCLKRQADVWSSAWKQKQGFSSNHVL